MPVTETAAADTTTEATGTGTGTGTSAESSAETNTSETKKSNVKAEVKSDTGLVKIISNYDDAAEKAQSYYVEMIDYIKKNNISRAVLVRTLVEARKIEVISASSEASRILKISKDDEVFNALKAGEITLKVAKAQTQKKRDSSAAATTTGSNEGKDKVYDKALQAFAASAKALGMDLKSILASVKATLQADPYNIK